MTRAEANAFAMIFLKLSTLPAYFLGEDFAEARALLGDPTAGKRASLIARCRCTGQCTVRLSQKYDYRAVSANGGGERDVQRQRGRLTCAPVSVDGLNEEISKAVERCHSAIRLLVPAEERPALLHALSGLSTLAYHLLTGDPDKARRVMERCHTRALAVAVPAVVDCIELLFESLEMSIAERFTMPPIRLNAC